MGDKVREFGGLLAWPGRLAAAGAVSEGAVALCAAALREEGRVVVAVLPTAHHAERFLGDVASVGNAMREVQEFRSSGVQKGVGSGFFARRHGGTEGLATGAVFFPMEAADDAESAGIRLAVARAVADVEKAVCVVTCVQALMQPIPDAGEAEPLAFEVGSAAECGALAEKLVAMGYERVAEVSGKRQVAVKGAVLDVWPVSERNPVRLETAEDTVASIRFFDAVSQCSVERVRSVAIAPAAYRRGSVSLADTLGEGAAVLWVGHGEIEEYASVFAESAKVAAKFSVAAIRERLGAAGCLQVAFGDPAPKGFAPMDFPALALSGMMPEAIVDVDVQIARRQEVMRHVAARCADGWRVELWLDTEGTRAHLEHELNETNPVRDGTLVAQGEALGKGIMCRVAPISAGFEVPELRWMVLSQADIYGRSKRVAARRSAAALQRQQEGERLTSIDHISDGDIVVHVNYGIGRFLGMTEIVFDGQRREVLTLEYADGMKLHVPVTQAHLLSRYVGTDGGVRLHALGGKRWSAEKVAAERAIADVAAAMLETQARRRTLPGYAFAAETPWLHEFEAAFPYAETEDQRRCIEEVSRDMVSPHPMDRLICGDAGYGKTEVAMRAAFTCAMQGRQVAVLVPTTVLAQQHYDTFRDRMAAYPINIAQHSRFCTPSERLAAMQGVANGTVDILIGTHGVLHPSVAFKDLGLVIIDEEQRFGVGHKEHFKMLRTMVDVLTLTATPIPRTLQLGLTGVRDLSLLQTPPRDRVVTETRVVRDTDETVKAAIGRELERGGQVFFLYNRILTIHRMYERIRRLLPHARIAVGHGQMPSRDIEAIMRDFAAGEIDILVCTTIIESGVDIPRANTILVNRADRFGVADLYQLRGRVGRGARKGYALFLVPEEATLDSDARKRLEALQRHTGAGAGFHLAMQDLGIRGAGNILGAAQSGHIAAIGFTLYCQLLRRTVATMKGEAPPAIVDVTLLMDLLAVSPGAADDGHTACLTYGYIEEDAQRIAVYRRLAECTQIAELDTLAAELADRYGKPPPPVRRLLAVTRLRIAAAASGIERITVKDGTAHLYRDGIPLRIRGELPRLPPANVDSQITALLALVHRRV
ncbi:MAG: transcription-repair coupling factor [Kiritimatiellaeota bacterium]|nr:transcription-repair coupling factor [Kiritimatiellota bacterium]